MRVSYILLNTAFSPLLDAKLPDEDIEIIKDIIINAAPGKVGFHQLRTHESGVYIFVIR